jgi:hypothetical protein
MFNASTNFHHPGVRRYGGVREVVLVDCPPPDLAADRAEIGCVGPECGETLAGGRSVSAAIDFSFSDILTSLEI